ncbi:Cyclin-dependent protein kinase regulator pho80 [Colletotrichum higginsianum IMI 349063]|uniref:Cyclin-dependent protein kinase regulator pho80 n=2 Tax=Colletotrichum higginsianum (strain IMI 349063) TaxID=759273 RepID=A0A1B7XV13_COLHI|nr:Cyclin-dependent protein kinase regulator pho80 [Colletotrichum higginsianum IMI 349063]OBR03601.1 Cyclin-dependent protein kinase regulator pho80 [Colletotrichum higginsianum IMI 349063]
MRATTLLSAFFAATLAAAETRLAKVYIEPVSPTPQTPALLAEIEYDAKHPADASVTSYEAPDLSAGANEGPVPKLVRIGIFDPSTSEWTSSVSVASTENFDKGYAPNIILSVDGVSEEVVGAGLKGVRIDAGATRDFGPQAVMRVSVQGKTPELNKPVVLSPEGRKVVQEEKPFWLKYVALILEVPENRGGRGVANVCAGTGG